MKTSGKSVVKQEFMYTLGSNKDLLMAPKDKVSITSKGGVINRYKCDHLGCTVQYIGETGRTFRDRYKEPLRAPLHP